MQACFREYATTLEPAQSALQELLSGGAGGSGALHMGQVREFLQNHWPGLLQVWPHLQNNLAQIKLTFASSPMMPLWAKEVLKWTEEVTLLVEDLSVALVATGCHLFNDLANSTLPDEAPAAEAADAKDAEVADEDGTGKEAVAADGEEEDAAEEAVGAEEVEEEVAAEEEVAVEEEAPEVATGEGDQQVDLADLFLGDSGGADSSAVFETLRDLRVSITMKMTTVIAACSQLEMLPDQPARVTWSREAPSHWQPLLKVLVD